MGVDPISAVEIRKQIKRLSREKGVTTLITSHYMREIEMLCDRIAVMNRGRIVACGSLEDLRKAVSPGKVASIEVFNMSERALLKIKSLEGVEGVTPTGGCSHVARSTLRVELSGGEEVLAGVLRSLRDEMV